MAGDIFDQRRRALRFARAAGRHGYFTQQVAELLIERVADVPRRFGRALLIGDGGGPLAAKLGAKVDRLDIWPPHSTINVEPESYDLLLWPLGLEGEGDVPDALLRARIALRPDGVLVGALFGDGSFAALRRAMQAADAPHIVARMHPQISLAAVGDLLHKIGLRLIVTDVERLTWAYRSLSALVADLRDAALTNMLSGAVHPIGRAQWQRAEQAFMADATHGHDGVLRGRVDARLLLFTAWAPHPDQPQEKRALNTGIFDKLP